MWTSGGVNNSWQWGIPNSILIDTASDGSHAWVTNLTGNYNANEKAMYNHHVLISLIYLIRGYTSTYGMNVKLVGMVLICNIQQI